MKSRQNRDERAKHRHEYAEGRISREMLVFRLDGRREDK